MIQHCCVVGEVGGPAVIEHFCVVVKVGWK